MKFVGTLRTARSVVAKRFAAKRLAAQRLAALGLATLQFVGCGAGAADRNCSSVKTFVRNEQQHVEAMKSFRERWQAPEFSNGGFLDISFMYDVNGDLGVSEFDMRRLGTRRCAAYVTLDPDENLRVWTADHCLDPARDVQFMLQVYVNQGYTALPIESDYLSLVAAARRDSKILPPDAREEFLASFGTPEELKDVGVDRCREVSTRLDPVPEVDRACFTFADLATFRVRLPAELEPAQREAVEALKLRRANLVDGLLKSSENQAMQLDTAKFESDLIAAFEGMMAYRRASGNMRLAGTLAECSDPKAMHAVCDPEHADSVGKLYQKYFTHGKFGKVSAGGLLDALTTLIEKLNPRDEASLWRQEASDRYDLARDRLKEVWSLANEENGLSRVWFIFQTNLSYHSPRAILDPFLKGVVGTFFGWMPASRSLFDAGSGMGDGSVGLDVYDELDVFNNTMVFSIHRQKALWSLSSGDSGTVVSLGSFPFGVLSTLNNQATEGAVITVLPRSQRVFEEEDEEMDTAPRDVSEDNQRDKAESMASTASVGKEPVKKSYPQTPLLCEK